MYCLEEEPQACDSSLDPRPTDCPPVVSSPSLGEAVGCCHTLLLVSPGWSGRRPGGSSLLLLGPLSEAELVLGPEANLTRSAGAVNTPDCPSVPLVVSGDAVPAGPPCHEFF